MVSELAFLYNQIHDYSNCHHKAFLQYLIEADAENYSQAPGLDLGVWFQEREEGLDEQGGSKFVELTDSGVTATKPAWLFYALCIWVSG